MTKKLAIIALVAWAILIAWLIVRNSSVRASAPTYDQGYIDGLKYAQDNCMIFRGKE